MPKVIGTSKRSTQAVGAYVAGLVAAAATKTAGGSATFDSAAAQDFTKSLQSRAQSGELTALPDSVLAVIDQYDKNGEVSAALLDSAAAYEAAHGVPLPPDLAELALHNAYSLTDAARSKYGDLVHPTMDSATSVAHDPLSLQPNRAVVAILSATGEAIPFAHYLPADIKSNEARIAILGHHAGVETGQYGINASMDGIEAGKRFMSAMRTHTVLPAADGKVEGKITAIQDSADTCDQAAPSVQILRGRLNVYVNGLLVGREYNANGAGLNPVNGRVNVGGAEYVIGGTINPDTGEYSLTTTPALPDTVPVTVSAPLDFERDHTLQAVMASKVEVFQLYAAPSRAITRVSPDAQSQMSNELSLDPYSENVLAFQRQFAIERHFDALHIARRVALNDAVTFDYEWDSRSGDMTRSRIWTDFGAVLGHSSQRMVERTIDHGITHLYVGSDLKAQWSSLPNDMFEPSGVPERAGIYRFGRLFGKYECYYDPSAQQSYEDGTAQVLSIGRATNVARNMVVLGDAVAPHVKPLMEGDDQKRGAAFYGRTFTDVNPHHPSALGAAFINVINLR